MGFFRRKRSNDEVRPEVYEGLRNQVLHLTPDQLGGAFSDAPILALLMETGYPQAVATLVGVVDGSVSLYFSNGGGFIGAGTHKAVADSNTRWLQAGVEVLPLLSPVSEPLRPDEGMTQFVAITTTELRAATAAEEELGKGRHELSPFFYAGQDVITQIRLTQSG
jgi:hypothetical protein